MWFSIDLGCTGMKVKLVHREIFKTREDAKTVIFEFIEFWYSRQRIHSVLDDKTPVEDY